MTDRESIMAARAEKLAGLDQSYEAKCARAMDTLNRQLEPRILALRYIGPQFTRVSEKHAPLLSGADTDFVIANCKFCAPPEPEWFTCVLCDWETPDKWRMKLHNDLNPKWCRDRAAKKARKWAQHA